MKLPDDTYVRQNLFTVNYFMDKHGLVSNKKEATMVIATNYEGITLPFTIGIAKTLKLRVGSKFIEQITYVKV